jgi:hypothetical protein
MIHKYELNHLGQSILKLAIDYKVLAVQAQAGKVCIWVEEDPCASTHFVYFESITTGSEVLEGCEYISTVQLDAGKFIVHIYREL